MTSTTNGILKQDIAKISEISHLPRSKLANSLVGTKNQTPQVISL